MGKFDNRIREKSGFNGIEVYDNRQFTINNSLTNIDPPEICKAKV